MESTGSDQLAETVPLLPQDIFEVILRCCKSTELLSCALVCRDWVHASRRYTFGNTNRIILTTNKCTLQHNHKQMLTLFELLKSSAQTISPHIRAIGFCEWMEWQNIASDWQDLQLPALVDLRMTGLVTPAPTAPQLLPFQNIRHFRVWLPQTVPELPLTFLQHFPNLEWLSVVTNVRSLTIETRDAPPLTMQNLRVLSLKTGLPQPGLRPTFSHLFPEGSSFPNLSDLRCDIAGEVSMINSVAKFIQGLGSSLTSLVLRIDPLSIVGLNTNLSRFVDRKHNPKLQSLQLDLRGEHFHNTAAFICNSNLTTLPDFSTIVFTLRLFYNQEIRRYKETLENIEPSWDRLASFLATCRQSKGLDSVGFALHASPTETQIREYLKSEEQTLGRILNFRQAKQFLDGGDDIVSYVGLSSADLGYRFWNEEL